MKIGKNPKTSLNLSEDKHQNNKFPNSLMNKVRISNYNRINNINENENNFLLNNKENSLKNEEIKSLNYPKYKNENYITSKNNKNNDGFIYNFSNENWRKKPFIPTSYFTKNKVIKVKNQKIKRKILNSENNNSSRSNQNNFYKTSYPLSTNNNNYQYNEEEPFFLNDKYINNSFIINYDNKRKIQKNTRHNENNSKLLSKDVPNSLNNTERYIFSKFYNEGKSKNNYYVSHTEYSEDYITFRNKDYLLHKDNNKTIEAEKMNYPKKLIKPKPNLRNKYKENKIDNLTYNNNDINHYFNEYQVKNSKCNNISNLNSMNHAEKYNNENLGNSNEISSNENNIEKLKVNIPKSKTNTYLKNILFNNNNQINEYKYKDKNLNNLDNIFLNRSLQPSEIESWVISFGNSNSNVKDERNNIINFQNNIFNKIRYKKKRIENRKNYNKLSLKKKFNFNDEKENVNGCNSYQIYKKPNLSVSQNIIKTDYIQTNNMEDYNLAYSHSNLFHKNDALNTNEDIFYKRQYLGDIFMKHKNKTNNKKNLIKSNTVFRKKQINYLYNDNNTYNISSMNNTPIYNKKSISFKKKFNRNKLLDNNNLSNSQQLINKTYHTYIKVNNSKINSTYKLFNSQIINIKNNIYNHHDNNILNKKEYFNKTPFGEETTEEKNKNIGGRLKIINKYSFYKKYYNFYINIPKKIAHRNNFSKKIVENEIIMKKNLIPFSYYSKNKINILQIPKIFNCNYTKIYILKRKKEDNKINDNKVNDNKIIAIKNKLISNTKHNKGRNIIKRNNDNKLEYDSNTIKDEKNNKNEINKDLIKIKVVRRKFDQKPKVKNNKKDKDTNNIQKVRLNETEIYNENNINETGSIINDNKSEIINYPQIPLSPRILKKLEEIYHSNINNNIIQPEENNQSKKTTVKLKSKSSLRKRSSSIKIKDKKSKNINERNNILKIKIPNSESRKKKYKINVVKRLKIKYKQNLNDFSEEKILINNCNNDINEEQNIVKRNKAIKKSIKEIEKDKKIYFIIKEDLENYILFTMKNLENKNILINNYNYSIIGQLLIKEKIDLSNLINFYLKICFDIIDSKDKIFISNDYINNIIEKYKRTYLNKNNFIQIHEDILEILIDMVINKNKKNENKYKFDIVGALFYSLLINELFFISDLNMFINCEEQYYINIAKIIRYIIIYSNDDKFKNKYLEVFKNTKLFFNNPIYFKYVTKYLKLLKAKYYDN